MASRTITMSVVASDPRPGAWCDRCLLPSAFEVDIHAMCGTGRLAGVTLRTLVYCPEHGQLEPSPQSSAHPEGGCP